METKESVILKGLNEEQAKAVKCAEGPVLIVAGAGSGKTRVLTSRVAYILAGGVDPSRVLALTFTKKAAGEMKERIAMMVGAKSARRVVMGTFHAIFVRFLREYADKIAYPAGFTIYDTADSTSAIKACIKELGLDDKIYKPKDVLSRISMAKNNLFTPASYKANRDLQAADLHSRKPQMGALYELYQQKLKLAGVMDFDDILLNMNILLRDCPEALRDIADRFSYIMVDEYQDTNYAQYLILKKLARQHHNICVVGDDSQSIYAFRGAKIENILNFKKDYPECKVFRLERNYRSTATIVDAANSVIAHNDGRIPKQCYAVGESGDKIRLIHSGSEGEEAMLIVSDIVSGVRRESAQYRDFAILYRTNSQSRALEEQLRRRNIPYMIYSGNSFFDRMEVKDMMSYFKLAVNPNDDESFKRVVNKPARAIGETTVSALNECARAHGCSLFKASFMPDLEIYGLRPVAVQKIKAFAQQVDRWAASIKCVDAHDMAERIAEESGLYAFYKSDTSIEGLSRTSNVEELLNSVQAWIEERLEAEPEESFDGGAKPVYCLDEFLENISLLSNVDISEGDDSSNKVALMTVHSAKGLEFEYVYIAGMEENIFPSLSMVSSRQDIEEERRLFYVALTRAKKAVAISFAETRMRNGKHESNSPSRFIKEIDSRYVENPLSDEDFASSPSFGGFGSRFAGGYGQSSRPVRVGGSSASGSSRAVGASGSAFGGSRGGSASALPGYVRTGGAGGAATRKGPAVGLGGMRAMPEQVRPAGAGAPVATDADFIPVPMTELYPGQRIEHNRFGKGLIKEITGVVPELRAVIRFDAYGDKIIMLKHAKIRPETK